MGSSTSSSNASSSSSSNQVVNNSNDVLKKKIETAIKTGVLNIADSNLKPSNPVWTLIRNSPGLSMRLKSLDISGNPDLKVQPNEVSLLVRLKTLNMSKCNIQRIPNISHLTRLGLLSLSHNDLDASTVGDLPVSLLGLNLAVNHFSTVPSCITVLINLKELDLSNNRIESISPLQSLVNLVRLKLNDNILTTISEDLSKLVNLQYISLKSNRLSCYDGQQCIPEVVLVSTSLITIDLEGNVGLSNKDLMSFAGINVFLERRQKVKTKTLEGGAMVDHSLFGLQ